MEKIIDDVTYISSIEDAEGLCIGCAAYNNEMLCEKLSGDCTKDCTNLKIIWKRKYADLENKPDDIVNHPSHYTSHPSGIECIQITEHMGFNLGNAVKYIWRCDLKKDAIEDLEKAKWYIEREINKRKGDMK